MELPEIRLRVHYDALSGGACLHTVRSDDASPGPHLNPPKFSKTYEGKAAKVHDESDPLRYPWGDEYRGKDSLPDIANQLKGKPLTLPHPTDLFINGGTGRIIGDVIDAWVDGDYVVAQFSVTDEAAADEIARGTSDLSLGYGSRTGDDKFQRGILVDHLAVVPRGRCKSCELRADAAGGAQCGTAPAAIIEVATAPRIGSGAAARSDCGCGCGGVCTGAARADNSAGEVAGTCTGNSHATYPERMADSSKEREDAKLTAGARHKIPSHLFAVPSREALPLEDATHVRDAMARYPEEKFSDPGEQRSAFHKIVARAHELGIDPKGFVKKHGKDAGVRADDDFTGDPANDTQRPSKDDDAMTMDAKDELKRLKDALEQAEMDRDNARKDAKKSADEVAGHKKAREDAEARAAKADADKAEVLKSMEQARGQKMDAAITEAITAKIALLARVNAVLPEDKRVDAATDDRAIKVALVKHVDGDDIPAEKSPGYVDGMFEGAMKRAVRASESRQVANIQTGEVRRDNADPNTPKVLDPALSEADLKRRMNDSASTAWQRAARN